MKVNLELSDNQNKGEMVCGTDSLGYTESLEDLF